MEADAKNPPTLARGRVGKGAGVSGATQRESSYSSSRAAFIAAGMSGKAVISGTTWM